MNTGSTDLNQYQDASCGNIATESEKEHTFFKAEVDDRYNDDFEEQNVREAVTENVDEKNSYNEDDNSAHERSLHRRLFEVAEKIQASAKKEKSLDEIGNMGPLNCDSPLLKLYSSFSPSLAKYIEQNYEPFNIYPFMQGMDFSQIPIENTMVNPIPNNGLSSQNELHNDLSSQTDVQSDNFTTTPSLYPGSMFSGPTSDMINPEQIESYLNGGSPSTSNTQGYTDEVINTSEQVWPINNFEFGENVLPPVMLSNYADMGMLQQDLQNNVYNWNQCIFPIYFHPLMMQQEEKKKKKPRKRKTKRQQNLEESVKSLLSLQDNNSTGKNGEINTEVELRPSDEELLNKCKEALSHQQDPEGEQPATKEDTMKYLEEAALKLLSAEYDESGKKKHNCKVCGRWFNRLYTLETHMRVHSGSKPFLCEICGKRFRQSGTKFNHVRAVHEKEKPYQCFFCGKRFSHKSSLVVHERIHTKVKPFECETCGRRFTDRATFQKHKPIHLGIKPYICPLCFKHFSQKSNLKRHFSNLHKAFNMQEHIH